MNFLTKNPHKKYFFFVCVWGGGGGGGGGLSDFFSINPN